MTKDDASRAPEPPPPAPRLESRAIGTVDHVAIAVRAESLAGARRFMTEVLGARRTYSSADPDFGFEHYLLGAFKIEILWPTTQTSFLTKFLDKRGEGLHHITVVVDDLEGTCARLADEDIGVVDKDTSRPEWMTAFISPRSAFGVLYQIAQKGKAVKK
jgi:methylmalonyl-CoA epimerase